MIPKDLLLADGVVTALVTLQDEGGRTTSELTEPLELSESTVRSRMRRLEDGDLVETDADLRDGNPVKVHQLTEVGERVTNSLREILEGYERLDVQRAKQSGETEESDVNRRTKRDPETDERDERTDDGVKPDGFSFDEIDE